MKEKYNEFIQEPYKSGYKKAANGCWYVEEYFKMSHLERRKADPQTTRRPFAIHEV
jgi:hypothetical protein